MGILLEHQLNTARHFAATDNLLTYEVPRVSIVIWLLGLVAVGAWLNLSQWDISVSAALADGSAGFRYRHNWLFDIFLHLYAARFSAYLGAILILFNIAMWIKPKADLKVIIAARYIMFTWLSSVLTIAALKVFTTLPCPWDTAQFGGDQPYVFIYQVFSDALPVGNCFPSAHATGGYGLLGLGFVAAVFGVGMNRGVCIALVIGIIYGGTQIVRGGHFMSHDFFSAAICLAYAWVWAEIYLVRRHRLLL